MSASRITIPARRGKAAFLKHGQQIRVINTHGQQVIDTWAFHRDDLSECMSMEHSRTTLGRIMAHVGDAFVTTRRRPILRLMEDTSPGVHDTLLAACDRYRYELLGCEGYHDNCTDNLAAALGELGLVAPKTPSPWNVFMHIPVQPDGSLAFEPPVSRPGDYVLLRAEMDCVIAFSACPQDMVPVMFQKWTFDRRYAMLMPSSQGGYHGAHSRAVPALSERSRDQGRNDQGG